MEQRWRQDEERPNWLPFAWVGIALVAFAISFFIVSSFLGSPEDSAESPPSDDETSTPQTTAVVPDGESSDTAPEPAEPEVVIVGPTESVVGQNFPESFEEPLSIAPIVASTPGSFDEPLSVVEAELIEQFGPLNHLVDSNLEDVALVEDSSGDYLLTRSDVGADSRKQWNVPIDPAQEAYLVYRFFLEPGFDAGDGDGDEGSPSFSTGIKMPGLMRGDPGDNTGGIHTPGGFSGRLMIRGTESTGSAGAPRDGVSLAAYIYGQQIDGESITSGFGRDYYFLDGFETEPFQGIQDGIDQGVGDPRIWELEEGKWITLVLGYRVDGGSGWFKAWSATGNEALQPRLHIPNINWNGGDSIAGPDSILFQQFWGGSGSVWYPDEVSFTRFKDFAVYTDETTALTAASFLSSPIPTTE